MAGAHSAAAASTTTTTTTASQAWAILSRHARDDMSSLRLQELCHDNDRVAALVAVYNTTFTSSQLDDDNNTKNNNHNKILIADLSRQRMTLETVNHLFRLAAATRTRQFMTRLAWGHHHPSRAMRGDFHNNNNNNDETTTIPSMHFAMRAPKSCEMFTADGTNALTAIHHEWDRMERYSNAIRRGNTRGVSGHMIRHVIVIGRGVPMAALQFLYQALLRDEHASVYARVGLVDPNNTAAARIRRNLTGVSTGTSSSSSSARQLHFLTRVDPLAAAAIVAELDPASTLVISIALHGNEETGLATKTLKSWLLHALSKNNARPDHILAKHMMLVTGNDHIAHVIDKPASVYIIPEHSRCEAFSSTSAACLLPLAVVFGWSVVADFLAGAHDMDKHFVDTNMRHNIPVLLALADIWNETLLGIPTRLCTPFSPGMAGYPEFVATLEAQACSKLRHSPVHGTPTGEATFSSSPAAAQSTDAQHVACSSMVLNGGVHGAYDRALYQSSTVLNNEILAVMDNQVEFNVSRCFGTSIMDDIRSAEDAAMCSMFAHADEMAFGTDTSVRDAENIYSSSPMAIPQNVFKSNEHHGLDTTKGNRPSMLLIAGKLDAFACGQLVALAEHRAALKAHICGLDPFVREIGSSLRMNRSDTLKDELANIRARNASGMEEESNGPGTSTNLILSTKTILEHYAKVL